MTNENQISLLNDLLTKAYDAEKGYKEAADNVKSNRLKTIFKDMAQQRYDFGHQIKEEISLLGGEPDKGASMAAAAHRTWIDIKAALSSNDEKAVLEEVVRGEEQALSSYQDVLEELPVDGRAYGKMVEQRNAIRTAKDRMEGLEVIADAE
ncbi:MAG: PA2169 family four-helix-bundle protein [Bacteroidota bacterium]